MSRKLLLVSCATVFLAVGCVAFPEDGHYNGRYDHRYDRDYDRNYDYRRMTERQRWEYEQRQKRLQ
ncbi:hypothetical protein ABLU04_13805 [Acinetobacter indicus]